MHTCGWTHVLCVRTVIFSHAHLPSPLPSNPQPRPPASHHVDTPIDARRAHTPLNRPLNPTWHQGESARRLLPAPRTHLLLCAFFLLSMHAQCVGFVSLRSPLHGVLPPLHHQLVLLFLAGIRGLSFAHMSVL